MHKVGWGGREKEKRVRKSHNPPQLQKSSFSLLTSTVLFTELHGSNIRKPQTTGTDQAESCLGPSESPSYLLKMSFQQNSPCVFSKQTCL